MADEEILIECLLNLFQKVMRRFYDFIKFIIYNQYIVLHKREF